MPDGMQSPEQPGSSFESMRNLGKIGPHMEGASESVKAVTNPVDQLDPDANDNRAVMELMRMLSGRASTSDIEGFGRDLSAFEKDQSVENGKAVEKRYGMMIQQSLAAIDDLYVNQITYNKNPYPYDNRMADMTVSALMEAPITLAKQENIQSPEAKLWLKVNKRDALWLRSFEQTTVAQAAFAPAYWDIMYALNTLTEQRYKATVSGDDLQNLYSPEVPGLELQPEEKKLAIENQIGLPIPDKYKNPNVGLVKEGEFVGLKELGIKMMDASFDARMKIAATSQIDILDKDGYKKTFMGENLDVREISFYTQLMWRNEGGESYILAPHLAATDSDKKESSAILESILVTNAQERLAHIIQTTSSLKEAATSISDLVKEVKAESLRRISNWNERGTDDIVSFLSVLVTKQGIFQDYAFMHAYRYCWQNIWKTDATTGKMEKKKVDTGSIYSPSGDMPSLYWMRRAHNYDKMSNSRTNFLLPTSRKGREIVLNSPPGEMPKYKEDLSDCNDEFLKEQLNELFSKLPPKLVDKFKQWMVRWITPYNSKYVGEGGAYELEVPLFVPEGLSMANFFEAITLQEGKLNTGAKSVFQELIEGKKLSELNWGKIDAQAEDKWIVDLSMASRYLKIFIEVFDKEKDPFFNMVAGDPSTLGPKELAKRIRLSFRDSALSSPEYVEEAMIPFFITLAVFNKHGISGGAAWEITTADDKKDQTCAVDRFLIEMSYWKRAFNWLPSDRPTTDLVSDGLQYGKAMVDIATFYENILLRVGKSSAEESYALAMRNYKESVDRISKMPFSKKGSDGRFTYSPNKDIRLTH